jgi:hypothetical protein
VNLERLAQALVELNGRLRVGGMTDAEARQLPVTIDSTMLEMAGMSTWMTDAGPFDVLAGLEASDGRLVPYEELIERSPSSAVVASPSEPPWKLWRLFRLEGKEQCPRRGKSPRNRRRSHRRPLVSDGIRLI